MSLKNCFLPLRILRDEEKRKMDMKFKVEDLGDVIGASMDLGAGYLSNKTQEEKNDKESSKENVQEI